MRREDQRTPTAGREAKKEGKQERERKAREEKSGEEEKKRGKEEREGDLVCVALMLGDTTTFEDMFYAPAGRGGHF